MADEDKTFSQDEVNAMIANERRTLTAKFEEEKTGFAKQIEDTLKGSKAHEAVAAQSAQRVEELQAELDKGSHSLLKMRVGVEKGLPLPVIDRLQGDDEEALTKDAETLAGLLKDGSGGESRLKGGPEGDPKTEPDSNDMNARIRAAAGK
jgi:hypothetical protein